MNEEELIIQMRTLLEKCSTMERLLLKDTMSGYLGNDKANEIMEYLDG